MTPANDPALWLPYTQMATAGPNLRVRTARGVRLELEDGRELIDGIASWWCMVHGYRHPELDEAVREQLQRLSHVMLGGLVHETTERLAHRLVEVAPVGLNHVFFADSGSVGVEVALKMAVQYWRNVGRPEKRRFVSLAKAYHGDTLGCMLVSDPSDGLGDVTAFQTEPSLLAPAPACGFTSTPDTARRDAETLERLIATNRDHLAALIVEPILQAAGGFNVYSPHYLKRAREVCDEHGVLLICDEVATGFGRTGALFASDHAQITPDIMVVGKALTGGYTGHAATLATSRVFESFLGTDPGRALMHGPTFMGNPLACAVACKSLEILLRDDYPARARRIEAILHEVLDPIRSARVADVRVVGAVGVIEMADARDLAPCQAFAIERGVWLRPYGRYVYTMPPLVIDDDEVRLVAETMRDAVMALED
jgi:adenosylmethionine-8-amino-7-oxononanoate aminotransferase